MSNVLTELGKVSERLSNEAFLSNKGLSNEVGIHVLCYNPKDELVVREYFNDLKNLKDTRYNLIECNLYEIFISICEEKHILKSIPSMEEKKGKDYLEQQLIKVATPEAFVEHIKYEPHTFGDVLLLTGIGMVYPFMRSHTILDNIQHLFADIPILMLYPGEFKDNELRLFGKFQDGNYYRAFNLL